MSNLLEVKNITKSFNGIKRVDSVSFTLNRGDFLIIAGANGSGKTLLMQHLNGLYPVKKGTIFYSGIDCYKKDNFLKTKVGLIFQNPDSQIIGLTVYDDIAFGPKNLGFCREKIGLVVETALKEMEISHLRERAPFTLSGGEKKRVTIAGVLAMEPEVIIFDEPFIGLDFPGVKSVTKSLIRLKELGYTVIIITHDLEKIASYGNRLIIMDSGKIVEDGEPKDLIECVERYNIRRPIQDRIEDMTWLN
ncbi:ABC transporter ATP-binding protein [Thiospirochaeta perfilievii]|uniref:ABC transporter ATP-binding protein n=1 Tax=Thiospirochaeta perfilievii TaxID=252967 RepID=A0A5C1QBV0_9SPIO|nr:ABC transporter ATP-binding protein [Thiospirochaeta perfilievii]QEN05543.1 ABC transporter ATP-binding protein [Thiospirochaeta perfilievii]